MDAIVKTRTVIHDVADYLTRFDAPPTAMALKDEDDVASSIESLLETPERFISDAEPEAEPLPSREEIIADCEAKHESALAAERAEFETRMKNEREAWTTNQAQVVSRQLMSALNLSFERLRSDIARILSPFVAEKIMTRVSADLISVLQAGLANADAPAMEINGPRDLLEKIETALAETNIALNLLESDDVDAHVTFASTIVETSLGEWISRLSNERGDER